MNDRNILIAGNWKMNKTPSEAKALVRELAQRSGQGDFTCELLVCPPFTSISSAIDAAQSSALMVGAQNLHWEDSGAYTGEVSGPMLKDLGCSYVIIGHSERRQYFGESDDTVSKKISAAIRHGLYPIVCVGETLEQREAGQASDIVLGQLAGALTGFTSHELRSLVIAYEPVWAIGTGKTASNEQAQEAHNLIRNHLSDNFGLDFSKSIRILYGGSMKPGNARELLEQPDIDGGLIGGASLKADDFLGIAACAK